MSTREIIYAAAGVSTGTPNYIEEVFSTYLYTGNGSSQTITNGIQLGDGYSPGTTGGSGSFFPLTSYAQLSTGSAMNFGIGAWTIEFYFQGSPNNYGVIFEIFNGGTGQQIAIQRDATTGNAIYVETGAIQLTTSGATPWDGNWHHHAIVRNVNTVTYYIDGVSRGTYTTSLNLTSTATVRIGNYSQALAYPINGYLSNLRVVRGTAVYTSNFTVPSTALTAISGTQLLCMQGSTPFVDNSPNAFTITAFNGATSSTLGPFPYTLVPGKGGLTWIKSRASGNHFLVDTVRGATKGLFSNSTAAQATYADSLTFFNSNGFSLGADQDGFVCNVNNTNYCSWTFEKMPKFFDVVTYTGNGTAGRTVAHNLGSVPGMIIVKCTSAVGGWDVYHRGVNGGTNPQNYNMVLNTTAAQSLSSTRWNNTAPTSTEFTVGTSANVNDPGATYVAYLFAHNAGGFGLTGTDNVISCGSYTNNSSAPVVVNLGYEPQYVLIKNITQTGNNWQVLDTMRGMSYGNMNRLFPNLSNAESSATPIVFPTATGFEILNGQSSDYNSTATTGTVTYIYMAIRRGPMKTPTSGTTVFQPVRYAGNNTNGRVISTGKTFPTDWLLTFDTENGASGSGTSYNSPDITRLAGFGVNPPYLRTNSTNAESAAVNTITLNNSNFDYTVGSSSGQLNSTGANYTNWNIGRAPGFFDVVCYTGTGTVTTQAHNLGAVPELMIHKIRSSGVTADWGVYSATIGAGNTLSLNNTNSSSSSPNNWNSTAPTSSVFTLGTSTSGDTNYAGETYVAYLFATVAGVSKVGSYTGTGLTQTINAGLPTGARFVLIKRTDSAGNWWAWDTATGMVAGNDTRIAINQTASIINTNWVYTATNGFQIVTTDVSVNANGGSYIYLAIA